MSRTAPTNGSSSPTPATETPLAPSTPVPYSTPATRNPPVPPSSSLWDSLAAAAAGVRDVRGSRMISILRGWL
ncbi:MAG: hypothetical protein M1834_003753 [Cirrosporium novae-zelandiae]|nr:MAG: hypothetical protein M1834_003753 [Cirrosporium novae-zelandiae]